MNFKISVAELIDRLTVDHIKQFKFNDYNGDLEKEINLIIKDINFLLDEKKIELTSKIIRPLIILSQINLYIWNIKDQMKDDSENYDQLLKLAHQLNGTRNQIKNKLLELFNEKNLSTSRSNFETDGLENWNVNNM